MPAKVNVADYGLLPTGWRDGISETRTTFLHGVYTDVLGRTRVEAKIGGLNSRERTKLRKKGVRRAWAGMLRDLSSFVRKQKGAGRARCSAPAVRGSPSTGSAPGRHPPAWAWPGLPCRVGRGVCMRLRLRSSTYRLRGDDVPCGTVIPHPLLLTPPQRRIQTSLTVDRPGCR